MRRPVLGRSTSAPPNPTLDRRQKFALFGSILGIALVGFALPQLFGFLAERGEVLSGIFPTASAEASSDPDERSTFGGFRADPSSSPTPTPTPSPSSTPAPTPTPGGTLVGPFQPGNPAGPTAAPLPTRAPTPAPAPTTRPPSATPVPSPSVQPTAAPSSPPPSPTPVVTEPPPSAEPTPTPEIPPVVPPSRAECSDGIDNDRDLLTDTGVLGIGLLLGDPQCSSLSDPSESS